MDGAARESEGTVDYSPHEQYAGEDTPTQRLKAIIAAPDAGIVCLNDNEYIDDWQQRAALVRKAISRKLNLLTKDDSISKKIL